VAGSLEQVRKRVFFAPFNKMLKTIILPRQARDNDGGNSKRDAFSCSSSATSETFPFGIVSLAGGTSEGHANNMGGRKTPFPRHSILKRSFYQDRLGTNVGKTQKERFFLAAMRYAQSLNAGVLPTKQLPNTFVAQAFDAGA
jgi:hypothetical protein